jgi:hypothetical protein
MIPSFHKVTYINEKELLRSFEISQKHIQFPAVIKNFGQGECLMISSQSNVFPLKSLTNVMPNPLQVISSVYIS